MHTGPDPDDDMDDTFTDEQGRFTLEGSTTELTTIDPYLKVYHDCNDGLLVCLCIYLFNHFTNICQPCQRRWKFELPNKYITSSAHPTKTLDMGTWNLEAVMDTEERDCIH
jgi:hypothetical protein